MTHSFSTSPAATPTAAPAPVRVEWFAQLYLRLALGAAFLSSVAARFGLWGNRSSWRSFADFEHYTAQVNSFMPSASIPYLVWGATVAELIFGAALVLGIQVRRAAFGSAALLTAFALAMAISFGIKEPLDYSVFSAAGGALLLSLSARREETWRAVFRHDSRVRP